MSKCGAPSPTGNEPGEASRAVGVRTGKPIRTFVITEYGGQLLTALFEDRHIRLLIPEEPEESRVGNIYIGKVLNVVKNLGAAFIEFEPGKNGYFALEKNGMTKLATGTMLPVQVEKDAVKTKFPVLTRYLAFPGRYAVLTPGKPGIGISHRVKDEKTRERLKNALTGFLREDEGVILRTSAKDAAPELLLDEILRLRGTADRVARAAKTRTCYSLLYGADPGYLRAVRDAETALGEVSYAVDLTSRSYRRSLFAAEDIAKGERFSQRNVRSVRPAGGLEPKFLPDVIGRCAAQDIRKGEPLDWHMVEGR